MGKAVIEDGKKKKHIPTPYSPEAPSGEWTPVNNNEDEVLQKERLGARDDKV